MRRGRSLAAEMPGWAFGFVGLLAVDEPMQSKITYYGLHVSIQENVARFYVAMHIFLVMDVS